MSAAEQRLKRKEREYLEHNYNMIMRFIRAYQGPGLNKFSDITSHISIANFDISLNVSLLKEEGVNAILYLGDQVKDEKTLKSYKKKKIEHLFLPVRLEPIPNIIPLFTRCYDFIHKYVSDEKKVLVHCHDGLSLSVAIVISYFLRRYYMTNFKKNKNRTREIIDPQITFVLSIIRFLKELRPCIFPQGAYIQQILLVENAYKNDFKAILVEEAKARKKLKKKPTDDSSDSDAEPELFSDNSENEVNGYIENLDNMAVKKDKKKRKVEVKYDQLNELGDIPHSASEDEQKDIPASSGSESDSIDSE